MGACEPIASVSFERRIAVKAFGKMGPLVLAALAIGFAVDARAEKNDKAKASPFDVLKQLAGDWAGKIRHGANEHDATVSYKVTSGGSAVVETLLAGTEHEMVTVYHQDGD